MNYKGLNSDEVKLLQDKHGKNELIHEKKESFLNRIIHVVTEPMFLLLLVASVIYFVLGEPRDGIIMLIFINGIIAIDVIQEWKTDKTLKALKDLSNPKVVVIRDSKKAEISSVDLVPGDIMLIHEGVKIPADGYVLKCNGISIDESSLTGEAEPVWKHIKSDKKTDNYFRLDYCYAGTLVIQGTATILVDKIGSETEYGKIGKNISEVVDESTPLQKQTGLLVKICACIAGILFIIVAIITFMNLVDHSLKDKIIESILAGITLAMAMIPEEFPVILTVFLSMGAWRLAKKNSLVKKLPSVETLGAVSVLCVDKTGTITLNQMKVESVSKRTDDILKITGMGCEEETYDPMEKAMLEYIEIMGLSKEEVLGFKKIKHYPFSNQTKMVGNVYNIDGKNTLAVKGSPESILKLCNLSDKKIFDEIEALSNKGLRVIGVAKKEGNFDILDNLEDYTLEFCGLISLIDPPKESVKKDILLCNKAGIRVVMITGDNGITASSIAKSIGLQHSNNIITGDMINSMTNEELREKVKDVSIFSRVIPEHKMRIVKAFKDNGEIVAMTGDGVNDAPALKQADIGIAMGKRGSEVSREAADLILMDDNFSTIVDTVKDGRRIYDNIRKAVGYIFTIHVPIALSSLLAPLLGVSPVSLLILPLHVVLLELVIDPTCSIVLERQPAESDIMDRKPRNKNEPLVNFKVLFKSIIQGLVIFAGSFGTYYCLLQNNVDSNICRSMGIIILILSNLFLVQVNSSNVDYAYTTFKSLIKDKVMWIVNIITFLGIFLILYSPLNQLLKLSPLTFNYLALAFLIAFVSVFWYEIIKFIKKRLK